MTVLYDYIGQETLTKEYKQLVLRTNYFLQDGDEAELIINGTITKSYQKLIQESLIDLIKLNFPKFISACSNLTHVKPSSKILFGVDDDGVVRGIPILDEHFDKIKNKITKTITKIVQNKICGVITQDFDCDLSYFDLDNFQIIQSFDHDQEDDDISFTVMKNSCKTNKHGKKSYNVLKKYVSNIEINFINVDVNYSEKLKKQQEKELIDFLNYDKSISKINEQNKINYYVQKKLWIKKMYEYTKSNYLLFTTRGMYEDFINYISSMNIETLNDHYIYASDQKCEIDMKNIHNMELSYDYPEIHEFGLKCGDFYFDETNYQKILWKFKDDRRDELKLNRVQEPKIIKNKKLNLLLSFDKLSQRFIQNNSVKYYVLEIKVSNNINKNEFLIYYDNSKKCWISKKRNLCSNNGILEPQCL